VNKKKPLFKTPSNSVRSLIMKIRRLVNNHKIYKIVPNSL